MTKAELIEVLVKADDSLTKKQSGQILDTIFGTLQKTIKKDKRFAYPGFGTFTVRKRKARMGIDPRTKEKIKIKASKTVGFKPAKAFKEKL